MTRTELIATVAAKLAAPHWYHSDMPNWVIKDAIKHAERIVEESEKETNRQVQVPVQVKPA